MASLTIDKADAKGSRYQETVRIQLNILALLDFFNVISHGSVGA